MNKSVTLKLSEDGYTLLKVLAAAKRVSMGKFVDELIRTQCHCTPDSFVVEARMTRR